MSSGASYRPPRSPRLRTESLAGRRVRAGLEPVEDEMALAAAGLRPVSEVMGAISSLVTEAGFWSAGQLGDDPHGRTYTSSTYSVAVGLPPRITSLKKAYRTALERVRTEARAVGADGVVGLRLSRSRHGADTTTAVYEVVATGTAVRGLGRRHTETPFLTHLSGAQTAAAIRAGWVPVDLLVEVCLAIRVVDRWSARQRQRRAPAGEIDAYTDVVATCRRQARADFAGAARRSGADGAVLAAFELEFSPRAGATSVEALVAVSGTSLAEFRPPAGPAPEPLAILRLTGGSQTGASQ